MSRTTKAISDELLNLCKAELKKKGVRGENGRRLQAIISAKTHGISAVAKIYNISRETLMRWISKVKTGGVKNFAVSAGRGRRSK
jgi:transposase